MNENNSVNNQNNSPFMYNPLTLDSSDGEVNDNANAVTSSNALPNNVSNVIVNPTTSNDNVNMLPNNDNSQVASNIGPKSGDMSIFNMKPQTVASTPVNSPALTEQTTVNNNQQQLQNEPKFLNNQTVNDTNLNFENSSQDVNQQQVEENHFLNTNNSYNETTINDLNVSGNYNNLNKNDEIPYGNDPQVLENLGKVQKKTVTITPELKIVIIITIAMFIFILVMPYIFDLIRNIRY